MEPSDQIEICRASVAEILDLRYDVLRAGLPRSAANFPGDNDGETVHLAGKANGRVVACATVMLNSYEDRPALQLRGMAVDAAFQSRGIGARLLREVERIANEKMVGLIWANCRTPAVPFYRANGWTIVSEEFEIPTAGPHYRMVRVLDH
jgi:GNAT superfamily N-acetyltransferase